MTMLDYVLAKLRAPETVLKKVCADTGLKPSWLWQLKDGRIPDPSVRKIQALNDYFAAQDGRPTRRSDQPTTKAA